MLLVVCVKDGDGGDEKGEESPGEISEDQHTGGVTDREEVDTEKSAEEEKKTGGKNDLCYRAQYQERTITERRNTHFISTDIVQLNNPTILGLLVGTLATG